MKKPVVAKPAKNELAAIRVVGSIFRVRRDLTALIKKHVLPGSGMTLEEADLLLDLYGAAHLGWDDPAADKDGYVAFAALKASLVHSAAALSRRVAALRKTGLLEARKLHEIAPSAAKVDRKAIVLRITPEGIKKVQPVFERYVGLCDSMLKDVPPDARRTILQTNDDLMLKARWGV
jgi:DNA-binding MarR family transcriptional regulator